MAKSLIFGPDSFRVYLKLLDHPLKASVSETGRIRSVTTTFIEVGKEDSQNCPIYYFRLWRLSLMVSLFRVTEKSFSKKYEQRLYLSSRSHETAEATDGQLPLNKLRPETGKKEESDSSADMLQSNVFAIGVGRRMTLAEVEVLAVRGH